MLEQVDKANQEEREKEKARMASKKVAAAKAAEEAAKALAQKKKALAEKKKALAEKKKALAEKKRAKRGKGKPPNSTPVLKKGMRVCGRWNEQGDDHGLWFDGTILAVCKSKKTVHMRFDDGDEDDSLSWDHVSILEQG